MELFQSDVDPCFLPAEKDAFVRIVHVFVACTQGSRLNWGVVRFQSKVTITYRTLLAYREEQEQQEKLSSFSSNRLLNSSRWKEWKFIDMLWAVRSRPRRGGDPLVAFASFAPTATIVGCQNSYLAYVQIHDLLDLLGGYLPREKELCSIFHSLPRITDRQPHNSPKSIHCKSFGRLWASLASGVVAGQRREAY